MVEDDFERQIVKNDLEKRSEKPSGKWKATLTIVVSKSVKEAFAVA
jgi:hypothetical protein